MKNNKLKPAIKAKPTIKEFEDSEYLKSKKKTQLSNEKLKVKPMKLIDDIDDDDLLAYEKMLRE